ncbi:MAG: hypothetical protein HY225_01390 [Candidatus Vogelbacteria bacterium]|nr:hypothetical protein [Candidatus Vogelbacteria bacterium]
MEKLPSRSEPISKKIESKTIKNLAEPITSIIEKMKQNIDTGKYSLIIGDDASGRIPSLAIRGVINKAYEQSGREPIDTRFLALYPLVGLTNYNKAWKSLRWTINPLKLFQRLGQEESEINLKLAKEKIKNEFIKNLPSNLTRDGKRVLIVTELINTGSSLAPLLEALRESNIPFEIATLNFIDFGTERKLQKAGAENIHLGGQPYIAISQQKNLSGVIKDPNTFKLSTKPYKTVGAESNSDQLKIQRDLNSARTDVKKLSDSIYAAVWDKQ